MTYWWAVPPFFAVWDSSEFSTFPVMPKPNSFLFKWNAITKRQWTEGVYKHRSLSYLITDKRKNWCKLQEESALKKVSISSDSQNEPIPQPLPFPRSVGASKHFHWIWQPPHPSWTRLGPEVPTNDFRSANPKPRLWLGTKGEPEKGGQFLSKSVLPRWVIKLLSLILNCKNFLTVILKPLKLQVAKR